MEIDALLNKPVFSKLSPEQRTTFRELVIKLNGKTLVEAMPIMMQFMKDAPKGLPLSAEEQEAMTEVVLDSLDESERTKFKMMMAFVKGRG
jgi:hypothetical protein